MFLNVARGRDGRAGRAVTEQEGGEKEGQHPWDGAAKLLSKNCAGHQRGPRVVGGRLFGRSGWTDRPSASPMRSRVAA
ncbi:hypothetical protein ACFSUK_33655 [Sphingobium scionense]